MSGFAGIVSADGGTPDRKAHRANGGTTWRFEGRTPSKSGGALARRFCFTLLRTGPSPQSDAQPFSLDGRIWLLGDVRLDGREELVRKLEQHGEQASADATNEELILRAWRQWAEKSFEILMGDFAFALWDAETRQLWCVRDLMGVRPFFYAQAGGQFIFSNTLECDA